LSVSLSVSFGIGLSLDSVSDLRMEVAHVARRAREVRADLIALPELIQASGDDCRATFGDESPAVPPSPEPFIGALDNPRDTLRVGELSIGLDALGQVIEKRPSTALEHVARADPFARARV
jgi:hypothetical protein